MRKAIVFYKKEPAAELYQLDDGSFVFKYCAEWLLDSSKPGISLTLRKKQQEFRSDSLFPFFYHMLPEGSNKRIICHQHRIDEDDAFGLLLITAAHDTIGAVTIARDGTDDRDGTIARDETDERDGTIARDETL